MPRACSQHRETRSQSTPSQRIERNRLRVRVPTPRCAGVTSSPILEKEDLGYVTGSLVYALGQIIGYPVKVGAIPLQFTATSPKLTGARWLA